MRAIDIIQAVGEIIALDKTKIHLASSNGEEDPLDVYFANKFEEWQRWQTKKNFEKENVLSLIKLPGLDRWLFAGIHKSNGCKRDDEARLFYYSLDEMLHYSELNGRLIVRFKRPGRQSYLNAERWIENIELDEILPERMSIAEFPGYRMIDISKGELDLIISHALETWKVALSNVAGVYLISDTKSGKLYVGSATGAGGIWQRWSDYSRSGHGGNADLSLLIEEDGLERANYFRYSILELADLHDSGEDVLCRESHWKKILQTREHGLNSN